MSQMEPQSLHNLKRCKKNRKVHDPSSVFLIFNLFVSFPKPKKRSDPDGPGMVIHPKFPNSMGSQRAYDLSFVSPGFLQIAFGDRHFFVRLFWRTGV
jgi:hypothetical protein